MEDGGKPPHSVSLFMSFMLFMVPNAFSMVNRRIVFAALEN
jgi:hypothetical protein